MTSSRFQSLFGEAVRLHQAGRLVEALARYERLAEREPRHFDAVHLAGTAALQLGKAEAAIRFLERALRLSPADPVCSMRLALALSAAGRHEEAESRLSRMVRARGDWHEAWDNLGCVQQLRGKNAEAIASYRMAVARRPDYANGWCNLGLALLFAHAPEEALACQDKACAIDPKFARARKGRAMALQHLHRVGEAVGEYGVALELNPADSECRSYRLLALHYLDTVTPQQLFQEAQKAASALPPKVERVAPNALSDADHKPTNPRVERVAPNALSGADHKPANPRIERVAPNALSATRSPLRVAFLSPDLRTHSVAYFLEPLLRHLDRTAFEIILYHDHFEVDEISARLRAHAALWRNFAGHPAESVAAQIRADLPDVLVDLAGHSGMNRLPLFAQRLAPVQISYLGYPDTTGLPAMDYRFVDAITDPPGEADSRATERLVRFASTAWAYAPPVFSDAAIEAVPFAGAPLPAGSPHSVAFGSCNNLAKVSDATLQAWSSILSRVPNSRLLLKAAGLERPSIAVWFAARLRAAAIDPARVEFAGHTATTAAHLAFYRRIDIALDTFPYNGTTTTCEALWMGVPVITLRGDRHAARVGSSLLTAVAHTEWIGSSPEDFVRIACRLAQSPEALARHRATLRADLLDSPLMDHAGQAARFGEALFCCARESGLPPLSLDPNPRDAASTPETAVA